MPLPIPALKAINLWLVEEEDGWTVIDTGYANDEARAVWEAAFHNPMQGRPVRRVIVTHFHPDHVGLAGWLCERFGAELWMTQAEWLMGRMIQLDAQEQAPDYVVDFYRRAGVEEAWIEAARARRFDSYRRNLSPIPPMYRRIKPGDMFMVGRYEFLVIPGRGHAPEQACLYAPEQRILIAGDQILPRISPNIGVYAGEPDANPLPDFLDSLLDFEPCAPDTLVLPSHGDVFRGLHRRIQELSAHHEERLDFILGLMRDGGKSLTAADVGRALFRHRFDKDAMAFVVGETLSHLHMLMDQGLVERIRGPHGPDYFRLAS